MSSSYRLELNKWLSNLDVKADRVLDIGGSQEKVKDRVKSWDVKEYLIADLPNPHKDSPKPNIELDLNEPFTDNYGDIRVDLLRLESNFDMIFCLEVLDYVWSPRDAMETIEWLLQSHGTAWVSFPSIYPLHQPVEDDALRYMPGGIKKLAKAVGLTIEEIIYRRPETNGWQAFYSAERMRAAKHEDHAFTGMIVRFTK